MIDKGFLYVADSSFDQDTDPHVVVDYPPLLSDHPSSQPSLEKILATLPSQPPQTIRLLLEGGLSEGRLFDNISARSNAFVSYLKNRIPQHAPTQYKFNASSSLASVLAQFDEDNETVPYWEFGITGFSLVFQILNPKIGTAISRAFCYRKCISGRMRTIVCLVRGYQYTKNSANEPKFM